MLPTNVLQRTFQIKFGENRGTCFTIDVDGRQYIVTAKHVVDGIQHKDSIGIYHEGIWKILKAEIAWLSQTEQDIAILSPEVQVSPLHPLEPTSAGLVLGQDVYFCGYPYGLKIEVPSDKNRGFPLPLVKKGALAGMFSDYVLIDAINNPGFSGGPVVFAARLSNDFKVAGVISGYRIEYDAVLLNGEDIGLRYGYNTGLVLAYDLKRGIEYITQNPTGVKVGTSP